MTARDTLYERLGQVRTSEVIAAYVAEHGGDPMRAAIELARPPRSVA